MVILSLLPALAISGGGPAAAGSHTETVFVSLDGSCTGTLIAQDWVLTAAHCFDSWTASDGPALVREGLGGPDGWSEEIPVTQFVIHPHYVAKTASNVAWAFAGETAPDGQVYAEPANDLALLQLATPASGQPVAVNGTPLVQAALEDLDATVVGYGLTEADQADSGTKRSTTLPLLSLEPAPPTGSGWLRGGPGTCLGDSGAPALVHTEAGPLLVGTSSIEPSCWAGGGSSFVPLAASLDWIEEHVEDVRVGAVDPAPTSGVVDIAPASGCDVSGAGLVGFFVVPLALARRR